MKISRRDAITILSLGVITAGNIYLFSRERNLIEDARNGNNQKKQEVLDEAFRRLNPEHLSDVIYDPDFKIVKEHLEEMLSQFYQNPRELNSEINKTIKELKGHEIVLIGLSQHTGNGEKRPAFAKKEVYESSSINTIDDLVNTLRHEDKHAEQERLGYDFGNTILKGEELTKLLLNEDIRPQILIALTEIPAYAYQLEAILEGKDSTSKECEANTKNKLKELYRIFSKNLNRTDKVTLYPLEAELAKYQLKKYEELFKKIQ